MQIDPVWFIPKLKVQICVFGLLLHDLQLHVLELFHSNLHIRQSLP